MSHSMLRQFTVRRTFLINLVFLTIGAHGIFVLATTLLDQIALHMGSHVTDADIDIPLLLGFSIMYLSTLLRRRKQTAWLVALVAYVFMLGFYARQIAPAVHVHNWSAIVGKLVVPLVIIGLLLINRHIYTVKSDIRSFGFSLRFAVLVLVVTFAYGTIGFMLMDTHDFRQEITFASAMHRTIDQFGLTTGADLNPHTKRARLFVDSLSAVSVLSLGYVVISLFQPIRSRVSGRHDGHAQAEALLTEYPGKSEDFFKLWPHDKQYYFDASNTAGLAFGVHRGVAMSVGDPFGDRKKAKALVKGFEDICYGNDWQPAFIHTEPDWNGFYEKQGYSLQKIGEEAVVSLPKFLETTKRDKYFRQIMNKFNREEFTSEVLIPPHSKALLARLRIISDEWLARPGRAERGFMMGYYSDEYMQQCELVIARDSAGTIQGFMNRIPSYDKAEANFDLLRHANGSPGNINDYLLMALIDHVTNEGCTRLNMGLCPLSGLDNLEEKSIISKALRFVYSNGDRFYSFSGLRRFKSKYEPEWSDRYIVYKGGVSGFLKAVNVLTRAMRVKLPKAK